MGTYANFFIEAKLSDGKWHLLRGYVPFEEKTVTTYDFEGKPVKSTSTPDLTCDNGVKLQETDISLCLQGYVRDLFSNTYFNESGLNSRGFPDDMSVEAKSIFDKKLERIETEKKAYFEKYGVEKTWGGKWWWGESYATITELEDLLGTTITKWQNRVKKAVGKILNDSVLVKKNDELFNLVNKVLETVGGKKLKEKKIKIPNENTDNPEEHLDYLLEDEFYDILSLNSLISSVRDICDIVTDVSYKEIRVIVWLD